MYKHHTWSPRAAQGTAAVKEQQDDPRACFWLLPMPELLLLAPLCQELPGVTNLLLPNQA